MKARSLRTAAAVLAAFLSAAALPAAAQVVVPLEPMPVGKDPARQVAVPVATDTMPALDEVDPGLRRLPAGLQALRFEGETGSREWPVYLTAVQAAAPAQFQLGYLNAVSVMPEASRVIVSVNDVDIGEVTIAASQSPERARLDVPMGVLQQGFNAIGIRVSQRHRVDCSISATYELWTQVYPGMTGLHFLAAANGFESFADIAAVNPDPSGSVRVRLRNGETVSSALTTRMFRLVEQAAIAAAARHTIVDLDAAPAEGAGIDVAVGTPNEVAALGILKPGQTPAAGISLLLPDDMDLLHGRVTLLVVGGNEAELDRALAGLDRQIKAIKREGSAAGLRALANMGGRKVEPGSEVRFEELGLRSQEFNGRVYRSAFDIRVPYDFLSADYAKAAIRLSAGYAPGLGRKSQLVVRANGETASVFPLAYSSGEILREREIPIPLRFFHPGTNRIELEAHLFVSADESCDALAAMSAPSRLVMIDESAFVLPRVARLARMPNLAATIGAGFPYADGGRAVAFIPHPDRETLAAAATLAANMAVAAGKPLDLSVSFSPPPADAGSALVVGALRDLPPAMLAAYGLNAESMQQAWRAQMVAQSMTISQFLAPRATGSTEDQAGGLVIGGPALPQSPAGSQVSLDDWQQEIRRRGGGGLFGRTWRWVRDQGGLSRQNLGFYAGADTLRVKPETTLVLAQAEAPTVANATWTLMTAPTAAALARSAAGITEPALAHRLANQAIAFNASDDEIVTAAGGNGYFVMTQGFSLRNFRLIAAGWFSLNIGYYVLALLAACALLGTATWFFVGEIGHGDE
ncbi:MAG: cellulose biosynthesis cyclic di-GMP-binding regulatory protein BcsB [Propylenella sp.]